jgi:hypothetical protein
VKWRRKIVIDMNMKRTNATAAECAFRQTGEEGDETTTKRVEKRKEKDRFA